MSNPTPNTSSPRDFLRSLVPPKDARTDQNMSLPEIIFRLDYDRELSLLENRGEIKSDALPTHLIYAEEASSDRGETK